MIKKTILTICFLWGFLPSPQAAELQKTWYLRYQEIPDFSQVVISAGWSYKDLTGKEAKLYKKGILVVNRHNQKAGTQLKKRIKLRGYDIQTEVILEEDPKVTASYQRASKLLAHTKEAKAIAHYHKEVYKPSGMKLFPRVKIHINGKLKADLRLGEVFDGEMVLEAILVQAEPGHFLFNTLRLNQTRDFMARGDEIFFDEPGVVNDMLIQKGFGVASSPMEL